MMVAQGIVDALVLLLQVVATGCRLADPQRRRLHRRATEQAGERVAAVVAAGVGAHVHQHRIHALLLEAPQRGGNLGHPGVVQRGPHVVHRVGMPQLAPQPVTQAGVTQRIEFMQAQQAQAMAVVQRDHPAAQRRVGPTGGGVVAGQGLQRHAVVVPPFVQHAQRRAAGGRIQRARIHHGGRRGRRTGCLPIEQLQVAIVKPGQEGA
ncbi:hypothetical protein D3C71_1109310 [compost metagenome]